MCQRLRPRAGVREKKKNDGVLSVHTIFDVYTPNYIHVAAPAPD
jgi:hypothetical protein